MHCSYCQKKIDPNDFPIKCEICDARLCSKDCLEKHLAIMENEKWNKR